MNIQHHFFISLHPIITIFPPLGLEDLTVGTLINHNQQSWRQKVLHQVFNENDFRNMTTMPLMNTLDKDKIIWRLTTNGEYNLKYAYHHLMEHLICNEHLKMPDNQNLIWNIHVPPKVKKKTFHMAYSQKFPPHSSKATIKRSEFPEHLLLL